MVFKRVYFSINVFNVNVFGWTFGEVDPIMCLIKAHWDRHPFGGGVIGSDYLG